jgi:hypothetical protein
VGPTTVALIVARDKMSRTYPVHQPSKSQLLVCLHTTSAIKCHGVQPRSELEVRIKEQDEQKKKLKKERKEGRKYLL